MLFPLSIPDGLFCMAASSVRGGYDFIDCAHQVCVARLRPFNQIEVKAFSTTTSIKVGSGAISGAL